MKPELAIRQQSKPGGDNEPDDDQDRLVAEQDVICRE